MKYLLFAFMVLPNSFAKDFYVKSLKASVLAEPKNDAIILESFGRSKKVDVLTFENNFAKIKINKKFGFINKLFLSETVIPSSPTLLDKDVDLSQNARKRASSFTSSAAARGLRNNSSETFENLGDSNEKALIQMKANFVSGHKGLYFLQNKNQYLKQVSN